jgi:uncharacterized RDD family membrane protein YckC
MSEHVSLDNAKYTKVHAVDRCMAKGLDLIILVVIALALSVIWYPLGALGAICYALFQDVLDNGSSLGKMVVGLKVISFPKEGHTINWKTSAIRNLSVAIFTLFAVIPVMGWILMLLVGIPLLMFEAYLIYTLDSGYRLGDVMAGTKVVSLRNYKEVKGAHDEEPASEETNDPFEPSEPSN